MEKARKRVNLAVQNIVLGVEGYVIKHNNIRARDINLSRNDGTHLSDTGINVYFNTIQGALESFLSSSGPRVFPLQYQNLDVFSLSMLVIILQLYVSSYFVILSCGTTSR